MIGFDDILGQEPVIAWLRGAYLADRVPHGLIFSGPIGVGKATTAAALAALWLCEKPRSDTPCGKCESCRAISASQHPDYHVIYKELIRQYDKTGKSKAVDLSINVIRNELAEKASRKTVLGRGKVFVIEQAELMSREAQNAMLKTLEEPAGRTLIILLTDSPGVLLPTIRSRCQSVVFVALDEKLVCSELIKRGIDARGATEAAKFAAGSLGAALAWLADGVVDNAQQMVEVLDRIVSGESASELGAMLKKFADDFAEKQLKRDELASKDQAARQGLALYLKLAGDHLRRRIRVLEDGDRIETVCAAIDALVRAERDLDMNITVSLVFRQLSVSMDDAFASPAAR